MGFFSRVVWFVCVQSEQWCVGTREQHAYSPLFVATDLNYLEEIPGDWYERGTVGLKVWFVLECTVDNIRVVGVSEDVVVPHGCCCRWTAGLD